MTSRWTSGAVAVAVVAVVAGCGGGSSGGSGPSSPRAVATSAKPRSGLVGTIDRARLLTVCENLRGASTAVDTGMSRDQIDRFLGVAADLLAKPPTDTDAAALGTRIRADVAAARESTAVDAGLAFCRQRGG